MRNFIGKGDFVWYIGVVEDINDPIQTGRVRVRCFGYHTDDKNSIPTESLPWALPINPVTSASNSGVGDMPTGLVQGSWVIGFFIDGNRAQEPVVLGSIASIPTTEIDTQKGFFDPDGVFPRELNVPDVNKLSRGEQTRPYSVDSLIGEPNDPYNAQYPYNRVMETRSGHIKEYDDTPDHERIREVHKSGTFYEVHPNGSIVTHIVKDRFTVVASDDALHVKGNVKILVDGNVDFDCKDLNMNATTGSITIGTGNIKIGTGDVVSSGISLVDHTHNQNTGDDYGAGVDTDAPTATKE